MIYYKFLAPDESHFRSKNSRAPFNLLLIPTTASGERYCYAEIPENQFEQFLEDYGDGEILEDRNEFPDNAIDMIKGRSRKFMIVRPRKSNF